MNRLFPAVCCFLLLATPLLAQTDSVTISGRILNLTPRLYRESPNVLISRNNLLQADAELTRPAPLNPDGTYSVKMPIIFGQEEMYFSFASVSTAFLAAPGSLTISLNVDSLFRAPIPFSFSGVNARVNAQYARYKAFEAKQTKINNEKLSREVAGEALNIAFSRVRTVYYDPFAKFSRLETPFPLVRQWVLSANRYNAASFVYDIASYETRTIPRALLDSLRTPDDPILTAARTVSVSRMANYVNTSPSGGSESLPIRDLAGLILQHGANLSQTERDNLTRWQQANSARTADLRQMQRMIERNGDTLQRLMNYQLLLNRGKMLVDSASREVLTAYWLAAAMPTLTLDRARFLYSFARPRLTDERLIQSLDELYRLAVGDSVRIRRAAGQIKPVMGLNVEIDPGIFVSKDDNLSSSTLLDNWLKINRSKLVYILVWNPSDENARRLVAQAQRLRDSYPPNEVSLLYVALPDENPKAISEYIVRNNLKGDHFLPTLAQYQFLGVRFGFSESVGASLIDHTGKIVKGEAPLPDNFEELRKQIERRLK